MDRLEQVLQANDLNIPRRCKKCNGVMVYVGLGEYKCEDCAFIDLDDYGRVRNYLESHRGATAYEVAQATGVRKHSIYGMLKDGRFEISEGSKAFLQCELCGKQLRYGRFCPECESSIHRQIEEQERQSRKTEMHGYAAAPKQASQGERRFTRDK